MTAFRNHKLLTVVAGENVLRILPPLNVEISELDEAIEIMDKVCKKMPI
jgi:acetylornithine/N-succinyldiaminopimelate aminotransferase